VKINTAKLRAAAINNTLFAPTTLPSALKKLGFVQADPIQAPAAAQDLILRQRVKNYSVGDLDRRYASLDIEEDYFYAYGFMPRANWRLLHPRDTANLSAFERNVLQALQSGEPFHPKDLEEQFGKERVINAWGGYSKATTRVLDGLHHRGLLRIAGRKKGIRIYQITEQSKQHMSTDERSRELVLLLCRIFAPCLEKNLRKLPFSKPDGCDTKSILAELLAEGLIERHEVDGDAYICPTWLSVDGIVSGARSVRFLAPFDPLVWDRDRFERFWGWQYRFEAYTPVAKRVRGYYALPVLWNDDVVGWVNISKSGDGDYDFDLGFAKKVKHAAQFKVEVHKEVERMKKFLLRSNMRD
jgi:uncharacterized protein YcaQ